VKSSSKYDGGGVVGINASSSGSNIGFDIRFGSESVCAQKKQSSKQLMS
jgi:hypothetical protein